MSGDGPLVLILEDLHWADESTLLLVSHLADGLTGRAILVLGTYRDVELDDRPLLARAVEDLVRRRLVHQVRVAPFGQEDVSSMLTALAGTTAPAPVVGTLFAETQGNPFFVEEMFRYLVDEGWLLDAGGRFVDRLMVSEIDVPANVRLVIGRRLDRFSAETRSVLGTAAVIGRFFDYLVLEQTAPEKPDEIIEALEAAERARLIVPIASAAGERFGFVHELVRQTLLIGLTSLRRRRLHLRVADTIEALSLTTRDDRLADLAHHLLEAGPVADPARVFSALAAAGRHALMACAYQEAVQYFTTAAGQDEQAGLRERAELWSDYSRGLRSLGRWDDFKAAAERATGLWTSAGDLDAVARICADNAWALAWETRWADALATTERGLLAAGDRPTAALGDLLAMKGLVAIGLGDYAAGDALFARAEALAEQLGDQRLLSQALGRRAAAEFAFMRHAGASDLGRRAAQIGKDSGDLWGACTSQGFAETALASLGRYEEADALGAELPATLERLGHQEGLLLHQRARTMRAFFSTGDLEGLERGAQTCLDLCQASGMAWAGIDHLWLGLIRFYRGQWPEAEAPLRLGVETAPPGPWYACGWSILAPYLAYTGRRPEVLALVADHADDLAQPGRPNSWGAWQWLFGAVEALLIVDRAEAVAEWYPVVVGALAAGAVLGNYHDGRLVHRVAGMAAAAGRDWTHAEGHYRAGLDLARSLPHPLEEAETRRWFGVMLDARDQGDDPSAAARLRSEAAAIYRRLGMPRHAELCAAGE
jgi:tetratricopeptide (TPR) repeat protein